MLITKACPRCGGDVYEREAEYGVEYRCLQAGHEVSLEHLEHVLAERNGTQESIKKEIKMRKKDIAEYREQNKEAIIADYFGMDSAAFLQKWELPEGSWSNLKRAWKVDNKRQCKAQGEAPKTPSQSKAEESADVSLPEHDRYLILLGYQQATRELLRANIK